MPTVDTVIAEEYQGALAGSTHMLLVGGTKMGKSDYPVQAAIDGFTVLYFDKDNGLATISTATANHIEARKRIHYFNPVNFATAVEAFLTQPIFRYNVRTKDVPNFSDKPDDRIVEIYPAKIPKGVIFVLDSWTSLCLSIMQNKADQNKVSLTDIDKYSREIYGGSGFLATQLATLLQNVPFHSIVIGHPGIFERKEKPENKTAGMIGEKDMIVRETTEVVISTSLPHGATLGKFFNQIGWLTVNRMNARVLDFRVEQGRMGGGTPNDVGDPRKEYRFSRLFGPVPTYPDESIWMREMTTEEMKAKAQASSGIKLGAKPAVAASPASTDIPKPATPIKLGGLKIGPATTGQ